MPGRLLASIDQSLTRRAQANAAAAVRVDARHAAERLEATRAVVAQTGRQALRETR